MISVAMAERRQREENVSASIFRGSNSNYINLISSDGHEFIIQREYALVSHTIRAMLNDSTRSTENLSNTIHFTKIQSNVLKIICEYFIYRAHTNMEDPTVFPIPSEFSLDVLMAASFLGI